MSKRPGKPELLSPSMNLPITRPGQDVNVSFEFFPPKGKKAEEGLWDAVQELVPLHPAFMSVTYGAGGTTRERTHRTVTRIAQETRVPVAAHLTCIGAKRGEIDDIARQYWDAGIRHIVALRGDMPRDMGRQYVPTPGGYAYASDLVKGLKKVADFEISVAGYPEIHPEARSLEEDIESLRRKVDNGASRIISQFFMEPTQFLRWRDMVADAGIGVPVVPGILPITNFPRTVEFAGNCGTQIPEWMSELYAQLEASPQTKQLVSAIVAIEQCRVLYEYGVDNFHFYTLNRATLTLGICHMLGIRPAKTTQQDKDRQGKPKKSISA